MKPSAFFSSVLMLFISSPAFAQSIEVWSKETSGAQVIKRFWGSNSNMELPFLATDGYCFLTGVQGPLNSKSDSTGFIVNSSGQWQLVNDGGASWGYCVKTKSRAYEDDSTDTSTGTSQ
ncbi:hypothetical protein ABVF61_00390 [Roseibium sp. HPY-6]|uniref:hypothetical protein n=1 Tax=Roseibium sp. HPY-6 TaxID=3229852 RepID=UPI003390563C